MLTRKLLSVIDNIVVDIFKIICCSEPTDSFMVNVTVSQLPGHSRGTRFYSRGPCPGWPPLGATTADGRHFENRYIAISRRKIIRFRLTLYTAADFELDERHMIKNEKVAVDRLRVRQNVFLVGHGKSVLIPCYCTGTLELRPCHLCSQYRVSVSCQLFTFWLQCCSACSHSLTTTTFIKQYYAVSGKFCA